MLTFHSFSSPTLKVVVGEEGNEEEFWVHQNILTSHSEFSKRATNGQWLESDERLVTLPEDRPDVFRLYLNLLYTKQIARKKWITLCQMYVLAEKLQDTSAKNSTINAMHATLQDCAPKKPRLRPKSIIELYSGTPEGSKARKFVADYVADEGHDSWLKDPESGSSLPPDSFLMLLLLCLGNVQNRGGNRLILCFNLLNTIMKELPHVKMRKRRSLLKTEGGRSACR